MSSSDRERESESESERNKKANNYRVIEEWRRVRPRWNRSRNGSSNTSFVPSVITYSIVLCFLLWFFSFLLMSLLTIDLGVLWCGDQKGCLWLSGIGSSIAYNWSRPNMKLSVKIIHARFDSLSFPRICLLKCFWKTFPRPPYFSTAELV